MRLDPRSVAVAVLATLVASAPTAPPVAAKPKLAVLVVVDQLRADYLTRWQDLFGNGGFRRLQTEGAWFQNCHYPYAGTTTGPGHASLATGCPPAKHGIIANEWYERASGSVAYCVDSERYSIVPPRPTSADDKDPDIDQENESGLPVLKKRPGIAPERLLLPTLGDALKDATGGAGRVFSLSYKERSAVLLGGHKPDACYWIDKASALAVTSTYYGNRVHPWVEEFNRAKPANAFFGRDWTRLRTDLDYERHSGPDDGPGEGKGHGQGRTFPHPTTGGTDKVGGKYYEAVYTSPFGNEVLLDLVRRTIDAEGLGTREAPDLLCVSFSSNDPVGHAWGPDSQEVLDMTLRTDLILKALLDHLDAKVGRGRYVLGLSADHGICPLPEVSRRQGRDAGFVAPTLLARGVDDFLNETYPKKKGETRARWVESVEFPWVYLKRELIKARGLNPAVVEASVVAWLKQQAGIETAYGRTELLAGMPENDSVGRSVARSMHPDRSGDVAFVLKRYYLVSNKLTGTSHGSPHDYDTHVPMLIFGPGVRAGVRAERVSPLSIAATLGHALGVRLPSEAGRLEGVFPELP